MKNKLTKVTTLLCMLILMFFIGITLYTTEDPDPWGQNYINIKNL
ncbi:MAG: hypothetical protein ACLSV2_01300 [Clostridium sp.]